MKKQSKIFKVTWPGKLGPEWLNKENLQSCLFSETYISNVRVEVEEIKDKPKQS